LGHGQKKKFSEQIYSTSDIIGAQKNHHGKINHNQDHDLRDEMEQMEQEKTIKNG
jgi:hypothetical protein